MERCQGTKKNEQQLDTQVKEEEEEEAKEVNSMISRLLLFCLLTIFSQLYTHKVVKSSFVDHPVLASPSIDCSFTLKVLFINYMYTFWAAVPLHQNRA